MELNIINYLLDKKKINQNELAKMLHPAVSKSTLSKWRKDTKIIPDKRKKELARIARIGEFSKDHSTQWRELTNDSEKIADDWYWKFAPFIINKKQDFIWKHWYEEIDHDSIWIENIQGMLITLNNAGIPVKDLDFTFDPTREHIYDEIDSNLTENERTSTPVMTAADELLIPYFKTYQIIRFWVSWHITLINDKNLGELQFELIQKIPEVAMYHIHKTRFEAAGTNIDTLTNYIEKSKNETFRLLSEFSKIANTGFDYFRCMTEDASTLYEDVRKHPEASAQRKKSEAEEEFDSLPSLAVERQILEGIKNNEKLLKEILQILNK